MNDLKALFEASIVSCKLSIDDQFRPIKEVVLRIPIEPMVDTSVIESIEKENAYELLGSIILNSGAK